MVFWIILALMAFATVFVLTAPLARLERSRHDVAGDKGDKYVTTLIAQYKQFQKDRALGLVAKEEADSLDLELKRALLEAEDKSRSAQNKTTLSPNKLSTFLVCALPCFALLVYFPLASRIWSIMFWKRLL
jgi:cytochrome c-type biogenesis protein CcmI